MDRYPYFIIFLILNLPLESLTRNGHQKGLTFGIIRLLVSLDAFLYGNFFKENQVDFERDNGPFNMGQFTKHPLVIGGNSSGHP